MLKHNLLVKTLMTAFLLCLPLQGLMPVLHAQEPVKAEGEGGQLKPIQVFDVAAGKVIKAVPNDEEFQQFAKSWLKGITGPSPQLSSDKDCSYVFRIPLSKQATVTHKDIKAVANDLFLFYCKDKPPVLLLFDENRRPYLFLFKGDITPFLKKVDLPAQ